jgi:hypothetical protein
MVSLPERIALPQASMASSYECQASMDIFRIPSLEPGGEYAAFAMDLLVPDI